MSKESSANDFGTRYQFTGRVTKGTIHVDTYIRTPMVGEAVQTTRHVPVHQRTLEERSRAKSRYRARRARKMAAAR